MIGFRAGIAQKLFADLFDEIGVRAQLMQGRRYVGVAIAQCERRGLGLIGRNGRSSADSLRCCRACAEIDIGDFAARQGDLSKHIALQKYGFRRHGDDFTGVTVAVLHFDLIGAQPANDEENQRSKRWRREVSYDQKLSLFRR